MKIENTRIDKNREFTLVIFDRKTFTRVHHIDKKIIEWKNSKTNHFVNAQKFKVLENAFIGKGKSVVIPGHKHVSEVKAIPLVNITPIKYDLSSPIKKNVVDQEIIRLCEAGTKLAAVKYFKDNSGLGLKESKDYVDELYSNFLSNKRWEKAIEPTNSEKKTIETINKRFHNDNAKKMFINRVRANTKDAISAIKFIKEETGWELMDSKIFYDYNVKV